MEIETWIGVQTFHYHEMQHKAYARNGEESGFGIARKVRRTPKGQASIKTLPLNVQTAQQRANFGDRMRR